MGAKLANSVEIGSRVSLPSRPDSKKKPLNGRESEMMIRTQHKHIEMRLCCYLTTNSIVCLTLTTTTTPRRRKRRKPRLPVLSPAQRAPSNWPTALSGDGTHSAIAKMPLLIEWPPLDGAAPSASIQLFAKLILPSTSSRCCCRRRR